MAAIQTDVVTNANLARWGANVYGAEYVVGGVRVDFQDLMVTITEQRAAKVEAEVEPVSKRMTARNKELEQLGEALSVLSGIESQWKSDDNDDKSWPSDADISDLAKAGLKLIGVEIPSNRKISKSNCEKYIQQIKTQIDKRNNEASSDMTRLQSLVDRRDESYSTATSLMQAVADTRSNIIKNM
ncbi:MAG: hypothetical protein Q4G65_16080 [bacterium]|nr:hypothetical protein [bacterium]